MSGKKKIDDELKRIYPRAVIKTIPGVTEGQACTALIGLEALEHVSGSAPGPITFGACDNGALYDAKAFQQLLDNPGLLTAARSMNAGDNTNALALAALREHYPGFRFVWIMGADNLAEMHRWMDWTAIFRLVPVAVFARPTYSLRALVSVAAGRFQRHRLKDSRAAQLADEKPPAWVFLMTPLNAQSATKIRSRSASRAGTREGLRRKRG